MVLDCIYYIRRHGAHALRKGCLSADLVHNFGCESQIAGKHHVAGNQSHEDCGIIRRSEEGADQAGALIKWITKTIVLGRF